MGGAAVSRRLLILVDWTAGAHVLGETMRLALAATASGPMRILAASQPGDTLADPVVASLDHLGTRGVVPEVVDTSALRAALTQARDVWCCFTRAELSVDILELSDDWLAATPDEALWRELRAAAQVVRV